MISYFKQAYVLNRKYTQMVIQFYILHFLLINNKKFSFEYNHPRRNVNVT